MSAKVRHFLATINLFFLLIFTNCRSLTFFVGFYSFFGQKEQCIYIPLNTLNKAIDLYLI